jgi:hypothetical protein
MNMNLGILSMELGDRERARDLWAQGLVAARDFNHVLLIASTAAILGRFALEDGEVDAAKAYFREQLLREREIGNRERIICSLIDIAELATVKGDGRLAALLLGVTSASGNVPHVALEPAQSERCMRIAEANKQLVDETEWAVAWEEGSHLTIGEGVERATNYVGD